MSKNLGNEKKDKNWQPKSLCPSSLFIFQQWFLLWKFFLTYLSPSEIYWSKKWKWHLYSVSKRNQYKFSELFQMCWLPKNMPYELWFFTWSSMLLVLWKWGSSQFELSWNSYVILLTRIWTSINRCSIWKWRLFKINFKEQKIWSTLKIKHGIFISKSKNIFTKLNLKSSFLNDLFGSFK